GADMSSFPARILDANQAWTKAPSLAGVKLIADFPALLIVAIIILVVLLLVVLGIFLGTMGRIGLIRGTLQSEEGATSLTFGELFNGGLPYFWRVFGLNLIVGLALALGGILVAVIVIFATILTLGLGLISGFGAKGV
ncbi:MAG: hypothetical protein P8X49_11505, partial [Syntrophobacterales bacterium]